MLIGGKTWSYIRVNTVLVVLYLLAFIQYRFIGRYPNKSHPLSTYTSPSTKQEKIPSLMFS